MSSIRLQLGSTVLEFLMGLLILAPIVAAALSGFKTLTKTHTSLIKAASDLHSLLKADAFLSKTAAEGDQHSLAHLTVIHLNGEIRYGAGALNPVSTRTDDKRPSIESDAISQISLAIRNALTISNISHVAGAFSLQGCPKYPGQNITFSDTSRSYLAVGTYGMTEFIADRSPLGGATPNCWEFRGMQSDGMILEANLPDLNFTRYLIPIDKIYTIYIDSRNRLRFIGHEGLDNKENQPLSDGEINFKLRILNWPTPHHQALEATFWPNTDKALKKFYLQRLPRRSLLDFLLN